MMWFIFCIVSFFASTIGAICGVGGGVIIKPTLDSFGVLSVSSISFLSSCTVLSMSTYSVIKNRLTDKQENNLKMLLPLAIGAAAGGIIGKEGFLSLSSQFRNPDRIGAIQAACLCLMTAGTLFYTIQKNKINTKKITNSISIAIIGMILGILSSFLGIGGGPMNLVVLYYFFSMNTKEATKSSLFIIFFSQLASLLKMFVERSIPEVNILLIIGMVISGILGGCIGRIVSKKIEDKIIETLFIGIMLFIILINIYNIVKYV